MSAESTCLHGGIHVHAVDDASDSSGKKKEFNGIISSTTLTSYFNHFTPDALKMMARDANKGVPVLPEHASGGQPIGKSISAKYDEKTGNLTSRFYIQKGLQMRSGFNSGGYADSDSYISAMEEGTSDKLSIGAYIKNEECDVCGTKVRRGSFFGMMFAYCERGHRPGQVLYVDNKGKESAEPKKGFKKTRVTSSITDSELAEFSVVTMPANPDARITKELQQAFERGDLTDFQMEVLADNNIVAYGGKLTLGGSDMSQDLDNVQTQADDATEPTEPTPLPNINELQTVRKELAVLQANFDKIVQDNNALQDYEQRFVNAQEELKASNERVQELETELEGYQNDSKVSRYNALLREKREAVVRAYIRYKDRTLLSGEEDAVRERMGRIEDHRELDEYIGLYTDLARVNDSSTHVAKSAEAILARKDLDPSAYR